MPGGESLRPEAEPSTSEHNIVALSTLAPTSPLTPGDLEGSALWSNKCSRFHFRADAFHNEKRYRNKRNVVKEHRLAMATSNFGKGTRARKSALATDMMGIGIGILNTMSLHVLNLRPQDGNTQRKAQELWLALSAAILILLYRRRTEE
ncbi:hypothetical protein M404DRAFT_32201 [Pisolithus tinctorius Marx 270]|uniref:Uncharacterized protein n=1 Tax=Pisolithus tinctorius Marx 270 TaxID=870435 RepID=A0A0C3NQK7_PISTI|nr:hypothetical protein M404DRAFT_32201 [Pisolithus tinctorius Marx 270]